MSGQPWGPDDQRWADVHLIAKAVARHVRTLAYVTTGGSDGCSLCKDRTTTERVAAGHVNCAEEGIAWKTAQRLAAEVAQFDLDITISRVLDDPRMFQWIQEQQR